VILAKDETKVRGRVSWEAQSDTLVGFCEPKENHTCITYYKPIVGVGEVGYTKMVESFRTDKIGGFARVIVVNPLHPKLPRLVLAACCTCGCFDSGGYENNGKKLINCGPSIAMLQWVLL